MKKLLPLLILVILVVSMPIVDADPDIETLWCDSYVDNRLGWSVSGSSPYLDDSTSYIYTKVDAADEGDYGFADLSSAGSITSVTLYLECYADDAPNDDNFDVFVYDGSSWTNEGNIAPSTTGWGTYETLDLSTKLGTDTKVNNAQVYFVYHKSKGADEVWIRRAYLYVDYTPMVPEEYTREVSQAISFAGTPYRTWTLTRDFTQGLTLASDSLRSWDIHRTLIQSTTLATTASRTWDISRTFTQGINLASNSIADIFKVFKRTLSLGIQLGSDSFRSWTLSRSLTQGLAFSSLSGRSWSLVRFATQSITANIEANRILSAFRQVSQNIAISSGAVRIGTFLRELSQTITLSSETMRTWTLSRTLTQGISFASSIYVNLIEGAEQFLRTLTLSMSLSTESKRSWTLARVLTQGISLSSLTDRNWFLIRIATQSITANVEANRILSAIRQASQNIALGSSAERLVSFSRGLSQSISLSVESFRTWDLSRSFSHGLSFISSIFVKLTEYIEDPPDPPAPEEFFRAVSLGIELVSSNIRQWGLTRIFSQGISFSSNIWTKLYVDVIRRVATMVLNLDAQLFVSATINMKYNIELIGLMGLSLMLQISYMVLIYKEHNPLYRAILGMITMACWFATGHVSLSINPDEGIAISMIYDIIGIVDMLFVAKAVLDFMKLSQESDDFWEIT